MMHGPINIRKRRIFEVKICEVIPRMISVLNSYDLHPSDSLVVPVHAKSNKFICKTQDVF